MTWKEDPMVEAYFSGDLAAAGALAADRLRDGAHDVAARWVESLLAFRGGEPERARRMLAELERAEPDIRHYEFIQGPIVRRRGGSEIQRWEIGLAQREVFRNVDGFLVSYPKCGRTWLRLMLGRYLLGDRPGDILEIMHLTAEIPGAPVIEFSHDDFPHWKPTDEVGDDKAAYRGKRVVFLTRDPRDAVVSYYFQYTRRGDQDLAGDPDFDGSVSDFIRHPIGGLANLVAFYNAWARNRRVPEAFLLQTYEDYHRDTAGCLAELIRFFGLPERGEAAIRDAVEAGRFENMRRLEETNALGGIRLLPPADGDPEGFKVRRGKIGGYVDYLDEGDVAWIDAYLEEHLDPLFSRYLRR